MSMKKFIYYLFGERAGRFIVVTWNWLWGISEPSEQEQAVSEAKKSLQQMQASVEKLTQAVAVQVENYQEAEEHYSKKVREYQDLETKAKSLNASGDTESARLTMIQVVQLEKILPRLKENVENAEKYVTAAKQQLMRQKEKLETYKSELANMQAIQEVNAALEQMAAVNNSYNIDAAKSQFEAAKETVETYQNEAQAKFELSQNAGENFDQKMEDMSLEEEVSRRLEG
ncbi:MAG: PspA/IM30 family protein [Halothece sp.]